MRTYEYYQRKAKNSEKKLIEKYLITIYISVIILIILRIFQLPIKRFEKMFKHI